MSTNRSLRRGVSGALALVATVAFTFVAFVLMAPVASASSPSKDSWADQANKLCRSASDQYFDLIVPDAVLHETTATDDDIRATGDYYGKVGRLYKTASTGLKRLRAPASEAKSVATTITAFDAAAAAGRHVLLESRSGRSQNSQENSRFAKSVSDADQQAGQAGQQARKVELEECVVLFEGGVADHQNTSTGSSPDEQCGNVDPNFFNQSGAEYNPQFVPCSDPHTAEQYATTEYPASPTTPFPGDNQLSRFGDDLCGARFKKYVGVDQGVSTLDYEYLTPYSDAWAGGDHSIGCILFDANHQPLTGSMKDSHR
jgi:Septum formation